MPRPYRSINAVLNKLLCGDTLETLKRLPHESVDCVVTSPPYWAQRDYGVRGQIGLESDFEEYLDKLMLIFDEIKRVLKSTGSCWVNLGDTYASPTKGGSCKNVNDRAVAGLCADARATLKTKTRLPSKSLCLTPSRFALRMLDAGWILRNELIWHKPNVIPQSARDRFTVDYEKLLFFVKSKQYFFIQQFEPVKRPDRLKKELRTPKSTHKYESRMPFISRINPDTFDASRKRILERGRIKRSVWSIPTRGYSGHHFASFPVQLIETPISAGCPEGGVVLDPFMGSGTTAVVAQRLNRRFVGIDLNPEYIELAARRLKSEK